MLLLSHTVPRHLSQHTRGAALALVPNIPTPLRYLLALAKALPFRLLAMLSL
jgi:hypothetical protein